MARHGRLRVALCAFALALSALLLAPGARASSVLATQGAAYQACEGYRSYLNSNSSEGHLWQACQLASNTQETGSVSCVYNQMSPGYYTANQNVDSGIQGYWGWCIPATCGSGPVDSTGSHTYSGFWVNSDGSGKKTCKDSCMVQFQNVASGQGSGGAWSVGSWAWSGERCIASYAGTEANASPVSPGATPPPIQCDAGQVSCYIPGRGACYGTENGEQVCTGVGADGGPPADNCVAGATGAVCAGGKDGSAPPSPPDPPIAKDSPPANTQNLTINTGGASYSQTVNNYSGTSPGGDTSSGGDTSGAGGSGTNTTGGGNSGSKGTDSTGKCPDGSVPTASGCSGTYRDLGCDTPPACFGDAVLCGIAANTHKAACNPAGSSSIGNPGDALAAAGVPADGGASGDPDPAGLVSSSDLGQDGFDASGLGFARTCPASPTFNVLGHSYTFDLTPFCNFASALGWFVLLVGFLAGLRIVAGGRV